MDSATTGAGSGGGVLFRAARVGGFRPARRPWRSRWPPTRRCCRLGVMASSRPLSPGWRSATRPGRAGTSRCCSSRAWEALASLLVWLVFGAVAVAPALTGLTWQAVLYAILSLTVVRMLPVAIALLGTGLSGITVRFIGWFGPRGLASVIFAVLALENAARGRRRTRRRRHRGHGAAQRRRVRHQRRPPGGEVRRHVGPHAQVPERNPVPELAVHGRRGRAGEPRSPLKGEELVAATPDAVTGSVERSRRGVEMAAPQQAPVGPSTPRPSRPAGCCSPARSCSYWASSTPSPAWSPCSTRNLVGPRAGRQRRLLGLGLGPPDPRHPGRPRRVGRHGGADGGAWSGSSSRC